MFLVRVEQLGEFEEKLRSRVVANRSSLLQMNKICSIVICINEVNDLKV